uniref:1-acyl-sn-glycerol-3-phosphate acyltransferase n=1 Tax=Mesocestoides corti TaxID=53468 RepID=A0A5K3FR66_MESCO
MASSVFDVVLREVQFWFKLIASLCILLVGASYYCIKFTFTGRNFCNSFNTILLWQSIARIIGMRHHVHGIGNRIRDRPCVLVVNHQSALDIPALIPVWPKRSTFVAKRSIVLYASFGLLVWFLKAILIDRSNRDGSIHKLKDLAKIIQNEKVSVIIFPEGTRGDGKSGLLPFKKGAFHLAIEAQVPIQPVVIAPYSGLDISKRLAIGGSAITKFQHTNRCL